MDFVDGQIEKAERSASPDRFPPRSGSAAAEKAPLPADEIVRAPTHASSSGSSASSGSLGRRATNISRVNTQRDLERHPTAMSRMQTTRSQHASTVGGGMTKSTTQGRDSKRPMPTMGDNKPYPPALPDQEDYVVEFEGPDDPLHPQNWPTRKK